MDELAKQALRRARAEGKRIGRPASLSPERRAEAVRRLAAGESVSAVARALDTSRQTVTRVRDGAPPGSTDHQACVASR